MVLLGRTSVRFGKAEGEKGDSEFFVPPESTVLFGMAERFVDTYGYHGDDSPLERAILFENLATLHAAMVSSPRYTLTGVDFPNFQLTTQEHEWYGVFDFIKRCQIARAAAPHVVCRGFGDALSRYNPALAPADRYKFEDPSLKDIPTRPNTPAHAKFEAHSPFAFDATVSSVGMAVVASPESDSDKENGGRGPTPVDVASGNEHRAKLLHLSLTREQLHTFPFTPKEPWPKFFEYRLRPMIYLLHSAVTHDFSLVGAHGTYTLMEMKEIKFWIVIGRLHDPMGRLDAFNIPYPAPLSIPGESVAMLEIMHRICRSIGFPCTNDIFYPLTRSTLLPFIEAANISRSVMNTSRDYFPYDAYGQPIHAEYLFFVVGDPPLPRENDIDEEPVGLLSGRRVVWVQSLAPGDGALIVG
ncbi:hypothetical protein C8R47DRAFT_1085215 [Mycena vitilis]|nr:hypothetical protein C8R47DRAFT_1085215 [Mycena vitilis]